MSHTSAPLRVHVLIDSLTWGGAEMLLGDLASGARTAGIELSVGYLAEIDGSPAAEPLRREGVEPVLVPVGRLADLRAIPRLREHLRAVRPHIVHTHLTLADTLGTIAARSLRLPAVSTIHLIASQPLGHRPQAGWRSAARMRLAACARRHAAARVIAVSEAARAAYLATGWDTPQRVLTVHNGIARTATTTEQGARLRAELGIAPEAFAIAMLTVLRPGKGHDIALAALRLLLPRHPQLRLIVLGDGPARAQIERLAEPLGGAALLTGHRGNVMEVLAASDVVLHPTSMDAFPTALLEAAAAAVPAVASRVGGIPEIVTDGETGLLLETPLSAERIASALEALIGDERMRTRLGASAQARFEQRFTAVQWAQRLRELYRALM